MSYSSLQQLFEENEKESIELHLVKRGVDPNRIHLLVDKDSNTATFLIFNLSGKLIGYQQYNPSGQKSFRQTKNEKYKDLAKYWTYVTKSGEHNTTRQIAVWGLDTYDWTNELFLTEGIFDCSKIHNAGYAAIATLSNDPAPIREWLNVIKQQKRVIAILDNDKSNNAGNALKKFAKESYTTPDPYKDLGEMPQDEVNKFINSILSQ